MTTNRIDQIRATTRTLREHVLNERAGNIKPQPWGRVDVEGLLLDLSTVLYRLAIERGQVERWQAIADGLYGATTTYGTVTSRSGTDGIISEALMEHLGRANAARSAYVEALVERVAAEPESEREQR